MRCFSSFCPLLEGTAAARASSKKRSAAASTVALSGHTDAMDYIEKYSIRHCGRLVDPITAYNAAKTQRKRDLCDVSDSISSEQPLSILELKIQSLESLSATLDSYNWLIKMRYLNPMLLLRSMRVDPSSNLDNITRASAHSPRSRSLQKEASSTQSKNLKRKGAGLDSVSSIDESHGEYGVEIIWQILDYLDKYEVDENSDSALQKAVVEVLYRTMWFIAGSISACEDIPDQQYCIYRSEDLSAVLLVPAEDAPSSLNSSALLRGSLREIIGRYFKLLEIFDQKLQKMALDLIIPAEAVFSYKEKKESVDHKYDMLLTLKQLYKFITVLEPVESSTNTFHNLLAERCSVALEQVANLTLSRTGLIKYSHLLSFLRDCELLPVAFGSSCTLTLKHTAVTVLRSIEIIAQCDGGGFAFTEPDRKEFVSTALRICLNYGLPMALNEVHDGVSVHSLNDFKYISLMQLLALPIGTFLYETFTDLFVEALLCETAICTLFQTLNLTTFLAYTFGHQHRHLLNRHREVQSDLLQRVLQTVIEDRSGPACRFDTVFLTEKLLPQCMSHLSAMPQNIFLLLLELDSTFGKTLRNADLHSFATKSFVSTCVDAKASCEALLSQLQMLPFLVCGNVIGSPRPLALFHQEISAEGNVRISFPSLRLDLFLFILCFNVLKILMALEEMVVNRFPIKSALLQPNSVGGETCGV